MSDAPGSAPREQSPAQRRAIVRRVVKLLIAVDIVLFLLGAGAWLALRDDDRANAVNPGLRGSRPPAGQVLPDLQAIPGLGPAPPSRGELRGSSVLLVATCMDCRSGDVIGGYLGRLVADDRPEHARIVVLLWDGDVTAWRTRFGIGRDGGAARLELHVATTAVGVRAVRRLLGIGAIGGEEESGVARVYDSRGRWRSTFAVGQLTRDDVAHDLRAVSRS